MVFTYIISLLNQVSSKLFLIFNSSPFADQESSSVGKRQVLSTLQLAQWRPLPTTQLCYQARLSPFKATLPLAVGADPLKTSVASQVVQDTLQPESVPPLTPMIRKFANASVPWMWIWPCNYPGPAGRLFICLQQRQLPPMILLTLALILPSLL